MVLVGENSGRLKWTTHRSLVLINPAAVFHVATDSLRKRNFFAKHRFTCDWDDPESKSIRMPLLFDCPGLIWIRPNVIGMRCANFARFVDEVLALTEVCLFKAKFKCLSNIDFFSL
jgi:hypothetical protein